MLLVHLLLVGTLVDQALVQLATVLFPVLHAPQLLPLLLSHRLVVEGLPLVQVVAVLLEVLLVLVLPLFQLALVLLTHLPICFLLLVVDLLFLFLELLSELDELLLRLIELAAHKQLFEGFVVHGVFGPHDADLVLENLSVLVVLLLLHVLVCKRLVSVAQVVFQVRFFFMLAHVELQM